MGKKLLITVGTAHYDNLPADLQRPAIRNVVNSLATLLKNELGYTHTLETVSTDPTSSQLKRELDQWFASTERNQSDWVVLYFTGHGELVGGDRLYLLTRDSETGLLSSTAFSVDLLASCLLGRDPSGGSRKVKRCLIVLDTCHSGAGAISLSHEFAKAFFEGQPDGMFYVLAAAFPREEAYAGALASALIEALGDESLGGMQQRLIYFDQLIPAINKRLRKHRVIFSHIASPDHEPEFFPNPRYRDRVPPGTTLAEAIRMVEPRERMSFWDPISRGVEFEWQPGSYFTGRARVLDELATWIRDSNDFRTRVITGRPGSGKSAILAKVVTLSDPEYRQTSMPSNEHWAKAFPVGSINIAMHAKGKNLQEIIDRLSRQLQVDADLELVLAALNSQKSVYSIVLDALDEAREPLRIIDSLLKPLSSIRRLKLLVGTRPELAERMDLEAVQIHVDEPKYFERRDLTDYVVARLQGRGDHPRTPYSGEPNLAILVAGAITEKAYPNFLIARLVAEDLLGRQKALTLDEIKEIEFPTSVDRAFSTYLLRFGQHEMRVRDLLAPLAWTEGVGLPWGDIWPLIASKLAEKDYKDLDVQWVLRKAGSFIVETLEQGRSVYRLYHQALADYLREGQDKKERHHLIVQALVQTVPELDGMGSRDWRLSHPYVRMHLAEHAAACGEIGALVSDPLFLLSAEPDRLSEVLTVYADETASNIVQAYQSTLHQLKVNSLENSAAYLEMAARKSSLDEFAKAIAALPISTTWKALWAQWLPVSPHIVLAEERTRVTDLTTCESQGKVVVIYGCSDGTIRVKDLEQGTDSFPPLIGHRGSITALTVADGLGRKVIVSGSSDNTVRLWDLERGMQVGERVATPGHGIAAVAITERRGSKVIVAGSRHGGLIVWDLERQNNRTATYFGKAKNRSSWSESGISSLTIATKRGRRVIVSGRTDGSLHFWDIELNKAVKPALNAHKGAVNALVTAQSGGRNLLFSGGDDRRIQVWDLDRTDRAGIRVPRSGAPVTALATANIHDKKVLIWGADDKIIRIFDLGRGSLGTQLIGHTGGISALSIAERQERRVILSGSTDRSIRVWDPDQSDKNRSGAVACNGSVMSIAYAKVEKRGVIVCGMKNEIRLFDPTDGKEIAEPMVGHTGAVTTLAIAELSGREIVVSGSLDKTIRMWDIKDRKKIGRVLDGHTGSVTAIAIAELQGRRVIVSGSADHSIRIWELESGDELGLRFGGLADSFPILTTVQRQGRLAIFSGTAQGIRIWEPVHSQTMPSTFVESDYQVTALAVMSWKERTVLVSAMGDRTIRVWDVETGEAVAPPFAGHSGLVKTLRIAGSSANRMVVSGGDDHTVRVWDLSSPKPIYTVDVGAPVNSIAIVSPLDTIVGTSMGMVALRFKNPDSTNV